MQASARNSVVAALLAGVLVLSLSLGCLYQRDRTVHVHGEEISQALLSRVEKGVTTRDELVAMLGPPHQVYETERGTEVLAYQHRRVVNSNHRVFLLLSSQSHTAHVTTYKFEVKDGVVIRRWVESTD